MTPSFLITHAWLRGNLGYFCITRQIVGYLRTTFPDSIIDIISMPGEGRALRFEIQKQADSVLDRHFSKDLSELFPKYSAVINAPGGGMQFKGDGRMQYILRDAATCNIAGIPHVMASHSYHPSAVTDALRGSLLVARESASTTVLRQAGFDPVEAADPAFLEPMPHCTDAEKSARERTLIMPRFDHFKDIRLEGRTLKVDGQNIELPDAPVMLGTSDPYRDGPLLSSLSESWRVPCLPSHDLPHLLHAISTSKLIVTDRYHPAIFSRMMGIPFIFLQGKENNRDAGLQQFLDEKKVDELAAMARHGLDAIGDFLKARI